MQRKASVRIRTTSLELFRNIANTFHTSSIMTPRTAFEYCKPRNLLTEKLNLMKRKRFDVIPLQTGKNRTTATISHYLDQETIERKIAQGYKYCKKAAIEIGQEDMINDLPLGELIHRFSFRRDKPKIPLFIKDLSDQIIGLVTSADLDKTAFKTYLFCLISELEVSLLKIVSKHFKSDREICDCKYCVGQRKGRETQEFCEDGLEEYHYLYLKELLHIFIILKKQARFKKE
jgi:hypothetical protein